MTDFDWQESFELQTVTYILELDDEIILIEGVPARVNPETGERLFAPDTVEQIHAIVSGKQRPKRIIQAPVFDFNLKAAQA